MPDNEELSDEQLNDLMAFLFSLTTPSADLMLNTTPSSVLSGLEVDRLPASEFAVTYDDNACNDDQREDDAVGMDQLPLHLQERALRGNGDLTEFM